MNKVVITVQNGIVECIKCPQDITVELHDYDIQSTDNPDCRYGEDISGDFEISEL